MLTLMLKLCLAGQPCKEVRIADFYTAQAQAMCELNRTGMQQTAAKENRTGIFSCERGLAQSVVPVLKSMNFNICVVDGTCQNFPLANFYGPQSAEPLCDKNVERMRPALEEAARSTQAKVTLTCK